MVAEKNGNGQTNFEEFAIPLMKSELDLQNIRAKALDRNHWQKIVKMVTNAAYSDIAL